VLRDLEIEDTVTNSVVVHVVDEDVYGDIGLDVAKLHFYLPTHPGCLVPYW
jgi:hypothetical protein